MEIIGEAVNRLTPSFVKGHPDFPTREAVSMRNYIIHEYDYVNTKVIWKTIATDIQDLREKVSKILQEEYSSWAQSD